MCPDRWMLSRARKSALLQIHGDEEEQSGNFWITGKSSGGVILALSSSCQQILSMIREVQNIRNIWPLSTGVMMLANEVF
jgi:hypothetical protein